METSSIILSNLPGGYSRSEIIVCVHCCYEELTTDGFLFKNRNINLGHNLLAPWEMIHRYGLANGIRFVTFDQVKEPATIDHIIFIDRPAPNSHTYSELSKLQATRTLILCENEVIKPDNWQPSFHQEFDVIFTSDDRYVDNKIFFKMQHCVAETLQWTTTERARLFEQLKLVCMIASQKRANHPQELYGARLAFIQAMQHNQRHDSFDLYGIGWARDAAPVYKGQTHNKISTLERYRFSICYENAREIPGYITEKIFDSFLAGTVPVYWGAPNVDEWIPRDCFIDRREFKSDEELYNHLEAMTQEHWKSKIHAIESFFNSTGFYEFTVENFITNITSHISRIVKQSRKTAPTISICIPNYNYGNFIGDTIESVRSQTVADIEILVFDNASTDQSVPKVRALAVEDHRIRLAINSKNWGAKVNFLNCYRCATGKYIYFLCADDQLLPGQLERLLNAADRDPDLAAIYSPVIEMDSTGNPTRPIIPFGHTERDYLGGRDESVDLLIFDCYLSLSASLIRYSFLRLAFPHVSPKLIGAGDWELWIRLAEVSSGFGFVAAPGALYRRHESQHTAALLKNESFLRDHITILRGVASRWCASKLSEHAAELIFLLRMRWLQTPPGARISMMTEYESILSLLTEAYLDGICASLDRGAFKQWLDKVMNKGDLTGLALIGICEFLTHNGHSKYAAGLYRLWLAHNDDEYWAYASYNLAVLCIQMHSPLQARMFASYALQRKPEFKHPRQILDLIAHGTLGF